MLIRVGRSSPMLRHIEALCPVRVFAAKECLTTVDSSEFRAILKVPNIQRLPKISLSRFYLTTGASFECQHSSEKDNEQRQLRDVSHYESEGSRRDGERRR